MVLLKFYVLFYSGMSFHLQLLGVNKMSSRLSQMMTLTFPVISL